MAAQPFRINVAQATLDDLQARLKLTRWTDEVEGAGWDYGTNLTYLKGLMAYWQDGFDWRAQEAKLNQFKHFRAEIDGFGVHFIHERGKGSKPLPIILTHGWPDSFYRFHKLIPLLTDPAAHGGDPADSFDVIVPSLPGYGFSDRAHEKGMNSKTIAELWFRLMTDELGYSTFAAQGGDIGSGVTRFLALGHPEVLVGIHLTDVGASALPPNMGELSEAEKQFLSEVQQWSANEGAYGALHRTKPQTLSYGLNDSPVGLAAWQVEKFRSWSDCDGDVEKRFSKDELLTHLMIYWATGTIGSSVRLYYENRLMLLQEPARRVDVPT
ncbi:MAG: epoxide hydrolase, partial [Chloroflexota bacterium]